MKIPLPNFLKRNPIDRMSMREIREESMRLRNQLERTKKNIDRLEKEKKKKILEGVGADALRKKMLAQEIRQIDMEGKMELKSFLIAQKQYMLVKNLEMIKKYEQKLKEVGMWKKLTSISPEELEKKLIQVNLDGKEFEEMLNDLNRVFEMEVAEIEAAEDEFEKEMMETWAKLESGEMDVESVEKLVSFEESEKE